MFHPLQDVWMGSWYKKIILIICLTLASLYPIYKNYFYGRGIQQYERHVRFVGANSEFYNPWQYRILCPMVVEGIKWCYDHSMDRLVPLESMITFDPNIARDASAKFKSQLNSKEAFIYLVIFAVFRFTLNILVYLLSFSLFACFTKNNWLNGMATLLVSFSMGNAVYNSDLSLNTYLDIVLFLWMACIVLYKGNEWWIIPITILGALNRETAVLIPVLYFIAGAVNARNGNRLIRFVPLRNPSLRTWGITATSMASFFILFAAIRYWYGYRTPDLLSDQHVPLGWALFKVNTFSKEAVKTYFEIYGALGFLPFVCLLTYRYNSPLLRAWSLLLVPVWIGMHCITSMASESRYYLVPLLLVLVPMLLEMIRQEERMLAKE